MGRYRKKRKTFPLHLPTFGPQAHGEALYEQLRDSCKKPALRERLVNSWIRPGTWTLIDHCATLNCQNLLNQQTRRVLGRRIRAALKADRCQHAANRGATIVGHLEAGDLEEACRAIKGWYTNATAMPPKPCYKTMATQTAEREELYRKVHPPGEPIPWNVDTTDVENAVPGNAEFREVVAGMRNGRAGSVFGMKAEDLKGWLQGVVSEEKEGGGEGRGLAPYGASSWT